MPSFDVVSKTEMSEVLNAIQGVSREMSTRFDFKGSKSTVELKEKEALIQITADDGLKLKQIQELIRTYMTRRGIDASALDFGKEEKASGFMVRQDVKIKQGIDQEAAKKITKAIKDAKMKVQTSIQGDQVRITGKKKDELQEAIAFIKTLGVDRPLQFTNFRD